MEPWSIRPSWRRSLRTRLVGWVVACLAITLLAFAAFLFLLTRHGLWREFNLRVEHEAEIARSLLAPYWTIDGISEPDFINPLADADPRWIEVWSLDGVRMFQSPAAELRPIEGVPAPQLPTVRSLRDKQGEHIRLLDQRTDIIGLPVIVRVLQSEEGVRAEIRLIASATGLGLVLCIVLAGWGSYHAMRRALQPMEDLVRQAASISADRLNHGLTVERTDDEIGVLAAAFNETMRRLNVSFEQARRFSADASHELRTPVTSIRTVGQVALQGGAGDEPARYRDAIGSMVEDAERLTRLLDTLLLLSRADAGQVEMDQRQVDLGALVDSVVVHCEVLADEKAQHLTSDTRAVTVSGDSGILRLALANLIDNAIRYTPERGRIDVTVSSSSEWATMAVRDSGPGISAEHHARLFDRFYRVDAGRSRELGGTGLGLSIARWAVALHGGRISVDSAPGAGSVFRIDLPLGRPHETSSIVRERA